MQYTGERMVPDSVDTPTFWEHIHRYRFAARHVRGRRVMDIASGEGYGTAALGKAGAALVIGMDIAPDACAHARNRYGVNICAASAQDLPLPPACLDVVVSFETIEHVPDPRRCVAEFARVLAPGGLLIISTPNRDVYTDQAGRDNPYHQSELNREEFLEMLRKYFKDIELFAQRPTAISGAIPALIDTRSFWYSMPGLRTFSWWIQQAAVRYEADPRWPADPIAAILAATPAAVKWTSPFVVRACGLNSDESPEYFLAVARVGR